MIIYDEPILKGKQNPNLFRDKKYVKVRYSHWVIT